MFLSRLNYEIVLTVHLVTAAASLCGFLLRGVWMWRRSPLLLHPITRIAPHVNDAVLLIAALRLATMLDLWPLPSWFVCKITGVALYIASGALGLRHASTHGRKKLFFCLALALFAYVAAVAWLKRPLLLI